MGETYGTYVDGECFDIHVDDGDTDHNTDDDTDEDTDDDTNDDTGDGTDDGGRGDLYTIKVFWAGDISGWKYWNGSQKNSGR